MAGEAGLKDLLLENRRETVDLFRNVQGSKWLYRYDTGKWNVKEVLQHITDTERIMAYRALRFSRGDKTELAGFEQDDYVKALKIDHLGENEMMEEWKTVRDASVTLFGNLHTSLLLNEGIANSNRINVEMLGRIIVGHTRHHLKILKEKYLIQ